MLFINPEEDSTHPKQGTKSIQDAKQEIQVQLTEIEPLTQESTKKSRDMHYIESLRAKISKVSQIIANKVTIKQSEIPQSII